MDDGAYIRKARRMSQDLESTAAPLVAEGKGILAADESVATLTRRFDTLGIRSTEQSRRADREMLFTATGAAEFISGAILDEETIRQRSFGGTPPRSSRARALFPASRLIRDCDAPLLASARTRARCNGAASLGKYTAEMEPGSAGAGSPADRRERHDD